MKIEKIGQYSSLPAIKKQRVNRNSKNGFWGDVNEIDYNFKNDCYFVYYYVNDSPRLQIKRKNSNTSLTNGVLIYKVSTNVS